MNRQLEARVERRIRIWILEQELEQRKNTPRLASSAPHSEIRAS